MGRLAPFIRSAESGTYALGPADRFDAARAAEAIASAIGAPVAGVIAFSADELVGRMTRGERADHLAASGVTVRDGLWLRLVLEHGTALDRASGGPERRHALFPALHRAFTGDLRSAFERTCRPALGHLRWHGTSTALGDLLLLGAWNGVEETLLSWTAAACAEDGERTARLSPMLDLLSSAVPLCECAHRPGVWTVLTG